MSFSFPDSELSAFIGDEPTLLYHISKQETCNLKLAGQPFFQSGFGVAFTKNSSLTDKLSKVLILYQELDTYRKLSQRWLSGACNSKTSTMTFKEMTIGDVGGVYIIILAGMFTSFLVLGFEFYVDKFGFPFSHVWTNKPHRHFPSTRQLYKRSIIKKQQPHKISTAPLELSISQRRFPDSMYSSSKRFDGYGEHELSEPTAENNDVFWSCHAPKDVFILEKTPSCPASPASIKSSFTRKPDEQDSGRCSF